MTHVCQPRKSSLLMIQHVRTRQVLATHAHQALSLLDRTVGLLGRTMLPQGEALIFPHCNSIHTFFMKFPIDVIFLRRNQVVKVLPHLPPFRLTWALQADTAIEFPAGTLNASSCGPGEILHIEHHH